MRALVSGWRAIFDPQEYLASLRKLMRASVLRYDVQQRVVEQRARQFGGEEAGQDGLYPGK